MRFRPLVYAAALLLLASPALPQGRAAGVTTQLVATEQMSETVTVFGQIVANRSSDVAVRVGGVVTAVPINVGDKVTTGAVLTEIDTERLGIDLDGAEAQIAIAEAGVVVAEARLDRADKAYKRAQRLWENETIPQAQLDERSADYAEALGLRREAEARIKAAAAALNNARYNFDNAVVRAPFNGIVLEVFTEVGQFIATGNRIATVLDTSALEVEANLPARLVEALQFDQAVAARTDTGETLNLELRAVLPTEFSATRTRPVRLSIEAAAFQVAVGQSITLELPVSAPRDVVVVPKDALVQGRGGWSVFVNADGKAQPRPITIGAALGSYFEVVSGLRPGDEVVVRGNERLRPGQDINPTLLDRKGEVAPDAGRNAQQSGEQRRAQVAEEG